MNSVKGLRTATLQFFCSECCAMQKLTVNKMCCIAGVPGSYYNGGCSGGGCAGPNTIG